jgi:hypothetical protein
VTCVPDKVTIERMTGSESQCSNQDGEVLIMERDSDFQPSVFKFFQTRRRFCIINLFILLLMAMLALSITLTIVLTRKDDLSSSQSTYSFDDMFDPNLKPKSYLLTWTSVGNEDWYVHWNSVPNMNGSFGDVVIINPSSDDVRVLVPGSVMVRKCSGLLESKLWE